MPDINLTQDARGTDSDKKKGKRPAFEYTDPSREKKPKDERKAPGSARMWFKSLFRRTPPGEQNDVTLPASLTPPPASPEKEDALVEDIFAKVDVPRTQRMKAQAAPVPEKPVTPSKTKLKKLPEQGKKEQGEDQKEMTGVNLLPEEFSTKIDFRGRGILLALSIGASVLVVVLVYVGLVVYEKSIVARTRTATETRMAIEAEIESLDSEQTASLVFEDRLKLTDALLNQHIYWTKFFRLLETYTVDDVYFNGSIRLTTPGQYTLPAIGKDYTSVARQLSAFRQAIKKKEFISEVEITNAAQIQDSNGVTQTTFTVALKLLPNVNTYTPDEFKAIAGQQTTTLPPAQTNSDTLTNAGILPPL